MGPPRPRPLVLDAGALLAVERRDRAVLRLLEVARAHDVPLHTVAGVVAQVWRDGSRQVRLARLVLSGQVQVHPLDLLEARGAGVLCGRTGTSDVVDASVALIATRLGATVLTSDPTDLGRLAPGLELVTC